MVRRINRLAHAIDHGVGRLRRRRAVLVEVRTPVSLAVLGPVYERLEQMPDLDVSFTGEHPDYVRPLLSGRRVLSQSDAEWQRFDVCLNGDPWAAARLRRCASRVNFFHGVAGKYDLDDPRHLPMGFELYDRVAFINRDRMDRYIASRIVSAKQARLIGYPKLDRLASGGIDGTAARDELRLSPSRQTVLYAPTYSTSSSLHLAGEQIVKALADARLNVIVKLHDRSFDADVRYTGGVDWRARMRAIERPGQVAFVEGADASACLAAADLMITDHSSVGFEYLVLDRPLIVYHAPELAAAARINPEKIELLRSAATVVETTTELVRAVREELTSPARLSRQRRRVATEMFHAPGTATDRAVALVCELLDRQPSRSAVDVGAPASLPGGAS
jgi:hypothetical protein